MCGVHREPRLEHVPVRLPLPPAQTARLALREPEGHEEPLSSLCRPKHGSRSWRNERRSAGRAAGRRFHLRHHAPHCSATVRPIRSCMTDRRVRMRQRTVNFAAKRFADMLFVTGLDRSDRGAAFPLARTGTSRRPGRAARSGCRQCGVERRTSRRAPDDRDQRCGSPRHGAVERSGVRCTGHRLGDRASRLWRHPARVTHGSRLRSDADRASNQPDWRLATAAMPSSHPRHRRLNSPRRSMRCSPIHPGIYGILIASPERVLAERYSAFGAPDRATPSWSMTKAVTCTLIGRLIHEGWLRFGLRSRAGAAVARSSRRSTI